MKIDIEDLSKVLDDVLSEYTEDVKIKADEIAKETAEQTANHLKRTSPSKSGKYSRGWGVKSHSTRLNKGYVVHNKRHYGLTHLLENGHVIKNQYGVYGRTKPIKHISQAEEKGISDFQKKIIRRLGE